MRPIVDRSVRPLAGAVAEERECAGNDARRARARSAAPTIGSHVDEHVASRHPPSSVARHDQAFARLVHHADVRDRLRHGTRRIGACIVDEHDLVGES